jgi:uroporphyrinogen decarboxylase
VSRPKNDTFLRALLKEPTEYTPLWLMRQAGRYLPEYCETRKRAGNFLNLCKSPAMACEVTLQPLARYDLDAAILFSDILTVPDAMGLGLYFAEGEGPFERPLREEWAINNLTAPDPYEHLGYVMDAVSKSAAPWTTRCR